jgi:PleD family two-component response regulator
MSDTSQANINSMPEYPARVLLVDDQLMIGEAVRRILAGESDISFYYCQDPARAADKAAEVKATVILQDLVMPNANGLDLVRRYREDPAVRDIPVIVLSTKEEPQVKSDSFAAGANDYLVKLPAKLELLARIRYHTKAYCTHMQRDEAYVALRESQQRLISSNEALTASNKALSDALSQVRQLQGLLPICCCCKKIRSIGSDGNYWQQIEAYISDHTEAQFSHTYCEECFDRQVAELRADRESESDVA